MFHRCNKIKIAARVKALAFAVTLYLPKSKTIAGFLTDPILLYQDKKLKFLV
jgi:hypothetical protein